MAEKDQDRPLNLRAILAFVFFVIIVLVCGYWISYLVYSLFRPANGTGFQRFLIPKLLIGIPLFTLIPMAMGIHFKWLTLREKGIEYFTDQMPCRQIEINVTTLSDEKEVFNSVREMADQCDIPNPKLYVLDDEPALNAFAVGLNDEQFSIFVTRNLLTDLNLEETKALMIWFFIQKRNGMLRRKMLWIAWLNGFLFAWNLGKKARDYYWKNPTDPEMIAAYRKTGEYRETYWVSGQMHSQDLRFFAMLPFAAFGWIGRVPVRVIRHLFTFRQVLNLDQLAVETLGSSESFKNALRKIQTDEESSIVRHYDVLQFAQLFFARALSDRFLNLLPTHPSIESRLKNLRP